MNRLPERPSAPAPPGSSWLPVVIRGGRHDGATFCLLARDIPGRSGWSAPPPIIVLGDEQEVREHDDYEIVSPPHMPANCVAYRLEPPSKWEIVAIDLSVCHVPVYRPDPRQLEDLPPITDTIAIPSSAW